MNILVVGQGGREHALARAFAKSPQVEHVFCAPGNVGMCTPHAHATTENAACANADMQYTHKISCVPIAQDNFERLADFCEANAVNWTFVGPELPLFDGIVDYFESRGLAIFGPTKKAAQIESSKAFAKNLMYKYHIPTAAYAVYTSYTEALAAVQAQHVTPAGFVPSVIKADGPAAGKGVIIAHSFEEARGALQEIFTLHEFGSQTQVVIEELLEGPEFSFFTLVYGDSRVYLPCAQDFKRQGTGDTGLNTGGMGAYTPVPFVNEALIEQTISTIVEPTLAALAQENAAFNGVLYTGLMLTQHGPKVIEFNARFGDPETQVVTSVLDEDMALMITNLMSGAQTKRTATAHGCCVGVVVAANGYPKQYVHDIPLDAFSSCPHGIELIYAGVKAGEKPQSLVSAGGRILMALSRDETIAKARARVYEYLDALSLPDMFYRADIAQKAE